jgi:predicted dehydrogenase
MRHFLRVASGEEDPLCTLDDGIRALQLALAAHSSQAQGKIIYL